MTPFSISPRGLGWRQGDQVYLVGKQVAQWLRGYPALQPYRALFHLNEAVYRQLREQDLTSGDPAKPIITVQVTEMNGTTLTVAVVQVPVSRLWETPTQVPAEFESTQPGIMDIILITGVEPPGIQNPLKGVALESPNVFLWVPPLR